MEMILLVLWPHLVTQQLVTKWQSNLVELMEHQDGIDQIKLVINYRYKSDQ